VRAADGIWAGHRDLLLQADAAYNAQDVEALDGRAAVYIRQVVRSLDGSPISRGHFHGGRGECGQSRTFDATHTTGGDA
jgi:hypothetical protein